MSLLGFARKARISFAATAKIEVFRSGCDKRIHPDDFSIFCQKRSSRVTWINWGLRLNDGRNVFAIVRSSRPFVGRAECADNSLSEGPRFGDRVSAGSNVGTDVNAIFSRNI